MRFKMLQLSASSVILFISFISRTISINNRISNHQKCSNGPYLYDKFTPNGEGLGAVRRSMIQSELLSRIFDLKYIENQLWYKTEHATNYGVLFDYQFSNNNNYNNQTKCRESDLHNPNVNHSIDYITIYASSEYNTKVSTVDLCHHFINNNQSIDLLWYKEKENHKMSIVSQILDTWHLRSNSTVYILEHANGAKDYMQNNAWDCLNSSRKAFIHQKSHDIKQQKTVRFISPRNELVIVLYMRHGDVHSNFPLVKLLTAIQLTETIFKNTNSILYQFEHFKIYFISEPPHGQGQPAPPYMRDFEIVKDSCSSEIARKIEIRADFEKYLEDFDIAVSADIFINVRPTSFALCMGQIMRGNALKIYVGSPGENYHSDWESRNPSTIGTNSMYSPGFLSSDNNATFQSFNRFICHNILSYKPRLQVLIPKCTVYQ